MSNMLLGFENEISTELNGDEIFTTPSIPHWQRDHRGILGFYGEDAFVQISKYHNVNIDPNCYDAKKQYFDTDGSIDGKLYSNKTQPPHYSELRNRGRHSTLWNEEHDVPEKSTGDIDLYFIQYQTYGINTYGKSNWDYLQIFKADTTRSNIMRGRTDKSNKGYLLFETELLYKIYWPSRCELLRKYSSAEKIIYPL